ncbi:hypothetical protein GEMRC1_004601 [Eukaryota sp. GEM-RC1]
MISIILLLLVSLASFVFLDVESSVDEMFEHLSLSVNLRGTAADISKLDRDISASIHLYTAFGDQSYLMDYFDLIDSGQRSRLISDVISLELSSDELTTLSEAGTILNEIRYLEYIAGSLTASVFKPHPKLNDRFDGFSYNFTSETNYFRKYLNYPESLWYASLNDDVLLPDADRLQLARDVLSNRRWVDLFLGLMDAIEGTADFITGSRAGLIEDLLNSTVVGFEFSNMLATAFSVICLILFIIVFKQRKHLKFGKFILFILALSIAALVTISLVVNTEASDILFTELEDLFRNSLDVYLRAVDAEWNFNSVRRRAHLLPFLGDFDHYLIGNSSYHVLLDLFDWFHTAALNESLLSSVFNEMSDFASGIQPQLDEFVKRFTIAGKLVASLSTVDPIYDFDNVTWNFQDLLLSEEDFWRLPCGDLSLTNDSFDLQRSDEDKLELALCLVSSRHFRSISTGIASQLQKFRQDVATSLLGVSATSLSSFHSSMYLLFNILMALIVLVFFFCLFFIVFGLPERQKETHVQQVISFALVNYFTRQYILSLLALFLILSAFYLGSLFAFSHLRPFPELMMKYGQRSSLPGEITALLANSFVEDSRSEEILDIAFEKNIKLLRLHHSLVVNFIDDDKRQSELLFDTQFPDLKRSYESYEAGHGLHP